jgi:hypothetical protein
VVIFTSEFSLRDPLALHHHYRRLFGVASCEPGSIHTEKIEDVTFNGAL